MTLQHVEVLIFCPMADDGDIILVIAFGTPVLQAGGKTRSS
jgi:hypothetical protein